MPEHTVTTPDGRTLELASMGAETQALGELIAALAATASPTPEAIALLACNLHHVADNLEDFACMREEKLNCSSSCT